MFYVVYESNKKPIIIPLHLQLKIASVNWRAPTNSNYGPRRDYCINFGSRRPSKSLPPNSNTRAKG